MNADARGYGADEHVAGRGTAKLRRVKPWERMSQRWNAAGLGDGVVEVVWTFTGGSWAPRKTIVASSAEIPSKFEIDAVAAGGFVRI